MPVDPHTTATPVVACPHCGKAVSWDAASACKPFCSERCRLIDLGAWLAGQHAIPGDAAPLREEDSVD
ncbi:MAG: DNA gyrase inhibitor YacG [Gammaproteobacteria bacterium]|nr:DNA gyrase inhibitor YacG [Gammaproteobacteria bacterium]MDE2139306.1 DNA gyrase inhibitor YacG [Gammaproteobacteria bacterium]MDE2274139.1 DNA gyrase inhibitor YacG [Gammaproteobacteria bacterium]